MQDLGDTPAAASMPIAEALEAATCGPLRYEAVATLMLYGPDSLPARPQHLMPHAIGALFFEAAGHRRKRAKDPATRLNDVWKNSGGKRPVITVVDPLQRSTSPSFERRAGRIDILSCGDDATV
jgi:hypothetical protein